MSEVQSTPATEPAPKVLSRRDLVGICLEPAKVEPLDIPGRGRVFLRVMSGSELDQYEFGNYKSSPSGEVSFNIRDARARLAAYCLCDAAGNRLFPEAGEADMLGRMPAPVLDAICAAAKKLNGMDRDSREMKEKNSSSQAAASVPGSGSPPASA